MPAVNFSTVKKGSIYRPSAEGHVSHPELNSPKHNHLLAALPPNDYVRLLPFMELYPVDTEEVLHEAGMPVEWIYFPTTAVICIGYMTENGSMPSVALVGKDGLVGLPCIMGNDQATCYATVQSAGFTYRIRASHLKKDLYLKGDLLRMTLLYSQLFFTQVSQTAVCNRLHSIDQQLCRYLLTSADLLERDEFNLTHEFIANMLGVRREGITKSAGKLAQKGLIRYNWGKIQILDKEGLKNEVCECYSVVKNERARLMPFKPAVYFKGMTKVAN